MSKDTKSKDTKSKSLKKLIDINRLREFKNKLNAQNVFESWPDGAEAHNAMWGGRDITAAFNNGTVSANIANGTFKDIFPGDYITKQVTIPDSEVAPVDMTVK